jgi:hypothetical protein
VLSKFDDEHMLMDHVHAKQQAVIEKLKQKRAQSLATVNDSNTDDQTKPDSEIEIKDTINITKMEASNSKQRDDSIEKAQKLKEI